MKAPLKILVLEDSPDDATLIEWQLRKAGVSFTSLVVMDRHGYQSALTEYRPDVILSDHSLPDFNSIEAFEIFKAHRNAGGALIPFILVTGNVSEEFAVQSIKAGIDDYILKDRLKRLPLAIKSALEKCKIENERLTYLEQVFAKEGLMNEAEQLGHFGSWEADLRTGKHRWSDATFALYGLRPGEQEPNYATFLSFVHPDDLPSLIVTIEDVLQRQKEAEYEFRIVDRGGMVKHINCKVKVERDADGTPVRLVGFNLDISERMKAVIALKESEQEFRSLFEQNPDTVFSLDVLGRFTRVNKGFVDMVGYSAEEVLGRDFRTILIKSELEKVYKHFLSALERKPQRYQTTFVNKLGKKFILDVTLMAVVVEDRIIGAHCIAKDITEKRNFESLLDQAYRTARIGSWEFDVNTNKLCWAGITKELHEVPDDYEPTIASGVAFYKEGRSREVVSQAIRQCINDDIPYDLELQIVTGKGNERWVRAIGQGARENGKCVRLYGTFQDIHERKIAEEASRKAFEEKVRVLESIGDAFFAVNDRWIVTYWNKMAETILKVPRNNILGKNLWEVCEDVIPLAFYEHCQKAMVERAAVHFEEYYPALHMWIEVNIYPSVDGLSAYLRDITKQKDPLRKIVREHEQPTEFA